MEPMDGFTPLTQGDGWILERALVNDSWRYAMGVKDGDLWRVSPRVFGNAPKVEQLAIYFDAATIKLSYDFRNSITGLEKCVTLKAAAMVWLDGQRDT